MPDRSAPAHASSLPGLARVGFAAALWGLWALFLRPAGLSGMESGAITALVMALSGLPSQWRHRHRHHPKGAWAFMGLAGLLDAANLGLYFTALARGPIAVAVLSHYLAPTLAPLFAWVILRERLSTRTIPASLLGLLGLALLLRPGSGGPSVVATALLGAGSAVFYAALYSVGKRLTREFTGLEIQSYHAYVASIVLFALAPWALPSLHALTLVVGGALLCAVFAGAIFYEGLARAPAGQAAVLTYLEPLTATAVGALAFGERLGPWGVLGAALVLGGGLLALLAGP